MGNEEVVIDYIDNVAVSPENHHNSLNTLNALGIGLFHLAQTVRTQEVKALEKSNKNEFKLFTDFGSDLELLLSCFFDWFSISLVSYMRMVRLMQMMEAHDWSMQDLKQKAIQKRLRKSYDSYINEIAPDVLQWRNKIAAHRSATDPRSDNLSTIVYSTFPPVGYQTPYYGVGHLRLVMSGEGTADVQSWSLTEKYEELIPRYWPQNRLTQLDLSPDFWEYRESILSLASRQSRE